MSRRVVGMVLAAAAVSAIAGCGGSTDGTPTTPTSEAPAALWNPCTEISDEALLAAGADLTDKETGIAGVHQSGWEICSWGSKRYIMTVFSTHRTVDEFENKSGNVDFEDVTVAGRQGRQFRVEGASKHLLCDVLFPVNGQGVAQLRILSKSSATGGPDDPCVTLYRVGESIVPEFPR